MPRPTVKYEPKHLPQQNIIAQNAGGVESPLMAAYGVVTGDMSSNGVELVPPGRQKKILFAWTIKSTGTGGSGDTVRLFEAASATSSASGTAITEALSLNSVAVNTITVFGTISNAKITTSNGIYANNDASGTDCVAFVIYTYV